MPHKIQYSSFREILKSEFLARKEEFKSYSLRQFAKELSVPFSTLSKVLNGKLGLSDKNANHIVDVLELSQMKKKMFLLSVQLECSRSEKMREYALLKLKKMKFVIDLESVDIKKMDSLIDWVVLAVYEMSQLSDFEGNAKWISERLQIDEDRALNSLDILLKHGLLKKKLDNEFVQTEKSLIIDSQVSNHKIQKLHLDVLGKSMDSLRSNPINMRSHYSIFLPISKNDISAIGEIQKRYISEVAEKFKNNSKPKKKVYCLNTSFFPIYNAKDVR